MFFTLSMADKRWEENFVSILAQRGCKITFLPSVCDKFSYTAEKVLVNDMPLEDFLANENRHDLLRKNVLTLTRNFDHRVKAFIRHIVRGRNNPMHVTYYTYRVEFQVRGAAHIHGVLWLDLNKLNNDIPNISNTLNKLTNNEELNQEEETVISQFVNKFVTVDSDTSIRNIVKDVQKHNHTKTCRKGGQKHCRFGFPRLPSKETLLAKPLKKEDFSTEWEFKNKIKELEETLETIKLAIECLISSGKELESFSIIDILNYANVTEPEYYEALRYSAKGIKLVLKREPKDVFINNYNEEWLRAWNGNMDLQICLDSFAIVTYITDYYSKDETGTTKVLKEAAKQNFNNMKDKMQCLAQTFLTHRQIGQCEAIYRILPSLHLSQSNVKCVFVHTGFPWNRHTFLKKVPSKKVPSKDSDTDDMDTS